MKSYQLSIPGPVESDPSVLHQLTLPNMPHYGDKWVAFYRDLVGKLRRVYRTQGSVLVIPCSGSGGLEAVCTSLQSQKGIILSNGAFGDRLASIARQHFSQVTVVERKPGEPFSVEEVEAIAQAGDFDVLGVVHGETSTGMLNDLEPLAQVCRRKNLLFFVDAVSTLGGVPLSTDEQSIDYCVSCSQKALGALPGLATISISPKGYSRMQPEKSIHGWYFNLRVWQRFSEEWHDWHPYPVTLPVHLFYALDKALDLILGDGLEKRWADHASASEHVQNRLEQLGIALYIKQREYRLPTVTAAVLPQKLSTQELVNFVADEYGIVIADGIGALRGRVFRIGHMAYSAQRWLVNRVISAIQQFLNLTDTERARSTSDSSVDLKSIGAKDGSPKQGARTA